MPQPSQPIQNVPPGIHTIPFGGGPGAAAVLMRTASDVRRPMRLVRAFDGRRAIQMGRAQHDCNS